ncbi:hypothetical protein ABZ027_37670 [Streptomyces sp. NPDC006332]|uniref:hypothetical protein n=1 Tax=Streptomyces sp. NPDC006332 TaxID=3155456 RepID=UPI0033B2EBE9
MKRGRHEAPDAGRGNLLADTVEGYLLARTHHDQARREAERLCARLPWLSTAQAEDVTRHFVHQRIELTRQMLLSTTERAAELRQEYECRYVELRRALLRRHAACASALLACTGAVCTAACLLAR